MDVVNVCFCVFVYFKAFAYEWFDISTVATVIAVLDKVEEDIRQHALSERISKHSCCRHPNEVTNCPFYTVLSQHHDIQSLIPVLRDPLFIIRENPFRCLYRTFFKFLMDFLYISQEISFTFLKDLVSDL